MWRFASSNFPLLCPTVEHGGPPVCQECPEYRGPPGWPRIPAWVPCPRVELQPHDWPSLCACTESHPYWPAHFWKETLPAAPPPPSHPLPFVHGALLLAQRRAVISPFVKRTVRGPHSQCAYPCLRSSLCSPHFLFCSHLRPV